MTQLASQPASFSLMDILRGMFRRKFLIVNCLVAGLCAGLAIITIFKPQYQSEARVLIDNLSTPFDQTTGATPDMRGDPIDDRVVASQVAVLESEDIATRVMGKLGLVGQGEFEPLRKSMGKVKRILVGTGFSDDPRTMTPEQRAYKVLKANLTIYPVPMSNVIGIKYIAGDGKTAAAVANALAEIYVLSTRERTSGSTERAREWLGQQIADLRGKVLKSEAAVERFRADSGLLKGQTATLGAQEISELNSQITLAEAASSEAEARAAEISRMLQTTGSVDASADVLSSPVIQALRQQQLSVQRKLSDLSATYLPNHPKVKAAQKEAADVDGQLRREAIKIVGALQGQANVAAARADSLRQSLEEMKGREGDSLQSDVKLKELEREATANRTLLETMLSRYADANARQDMNLQPGFARVIQTASAPANPYFPKIGPTVTLVTLAGLGFGLGIAFLLEIMVQAARINAMAVSDFTATPRKHPIRNAAMPEGGIRVPDLRQRADNDRPQPVVFKQAAEPAPPQLVAAIPSPSTLTDTLELLSGTQQGAGLAEPISRLAQALDELRRTSGIKGVGITSIGGNHQAAMVTVALARALASGSVRTIVVDATPARPSVIDILSLPNGPGLTELVAGHADFTKVILRDGLSDVQVVRYGMDNGAQSRHMVNTRIEPILTALMQIFDVVLVHAGEASPHTPAALQGCQAAVFLTGPGRQRDAAAAARTLATRGVTQALFVKLETAASAPPARMTG